MRNGGNGGAVADERPIFKESRDHILCRYFGDSTLGCGMEMEGFPLTDRRITIPEYAMALAHVASLRSEDPFRKVGAVAIDHENRVIGTAYNGLAPGYQADAGFWTDRERRQKFMLHAEINLCSLFTRTQVKLVACTTKPCTSCMQALCAHGVREVYFRDDYPASEADEIAERYGLKLVRLTRYPRFSLADPGDGDSG